jgi:vitamin B12 transporter
MSKPYTNPFILARGFNMKKLSILWLTAVTLCASVSAAEGQVEDSVQQLGTIVVSASKIPRPASTLTQAVTVISGDDLRARGVTRVTDALREVPGAALVQSGSYGAVTSLFLRGGESRYTKVLIDGVPVNSSGGFFDFSHLTTDNIDRIEIVRGPASVLYGADAVSGIVQIFTRRHSEPAASLSARGGTYQSLDLTGDVSGGNESHGYSFGAGHHSTDGILPFNNQYKNGTLSSAITLIRNAGGEANVSARYTAAEFHYPTDFTGALVDTNSYRTQHRLTVGLAVLRNIHGNVQGHVLTGSNDVNDLTEGIATPFGATAPEHSAFRSRGYRRNAEGRLSFFLPLDATATFGLGYEREHENSSNSSGPVGGQLNETDAFDASRHNIAYYSEILGTAAKRFSYTLSGRVDDNSDYDRFATYRLGVSAAFLPNLRLRSSISTAFNAPAFNQLRPTLFTVGSPNLRPERIRSGEAGIIATSRSGMVQVSANYFSQRFADLIQFVSGGPPDFKGSFANLTGASSNGYEAEIRVALSGNWRGSGGYTIVNPRVTRIPPGYGGSEKPGDALLRRPSHSGNAVVSYTRTPRMSFAAAATHVGKRPDLDFARFPSPRVTLPSYTKLDLSGELALTRIERGGVTLNGRLENVFDKRYEEVLHFPAPGRAVLIGARATRLF